MAVNDDELEKRAVEELLKEANRGRVRSETMGPAGWMKCPLRSPNKRFLLNTLRPCASERRSGGRSATTRGAEEGCRGSRDRPADRQDGYRKANKHKRESPRPYSQSSRSRSSSSSKLASSGHAPHRNSQSNRTRSRSPIRERRATKRSTDRIQKLRTTFSTE